MNAERRQVIDTEAWRQWEGRLINDVFPLRRFIGRSEHSAVFLTEYKEKSIPDAVIKFVRADTLQGKAQVAQWQAAAKHPHPHLVRLFAVGRCRSEGGEFLFVVMEYAEQTLAELLPNRPLTVEEAQEMLPPILDALAFLHRNHLAHGQVKPSNFMVVNDQLKLASDTVRQIGSAGGGDRASSYDPPELKDRGTSPAGDIWSLGITLVEALTQRAPDWSDAKRENSGLPSGVPASFVDTVRRCLSHAPANRPNAAKLAAHYKPAPAQPAARPAPEPAPAPTAPAPVPTAMPTPDSKPPVQEAPRRKVIPPSVAPKRSLLPVTIGALLIALAGGGAAYFLNRQDAPPPAIDVPAPAPIAPVAQAIEPAESDSGAATEQVASSAEESSSASEEVTSLSVLHEATPDVPQAVRDKVKGHIYVTLRVLVNPAGDVFGVLMENPGPSKYFARIAGESAREWKFAPAESQDARVWLLSFDFSRDGDTAFATAM